MAEAPPLPARYRDAFAALAGIPGDEMDALVAALPRGRTLHELSEMADSIATAAPGLSEQGHRLTQAIASLVEAVDGGRSVAEMAAAVSDAPNIGLDGDQRSLLRARVETLLGVESLRLAAKARDLVTDYEHVFASARVLTDFRPVFPPGVTTELAAAVIVATLKIDYFGPDRELVSFHVALNRGNLEQLSEAVNRGFEKITTLTRFLDEAQLARWEGGLENS